MKYKSVILAAALVAVLSVSTQADILDSSDQAVAAQRALRAQGAQIQTAFAAAETAIDSEPYDEAKIAPLWLEGQKIDIREQKLKIAAAANVSLPLETAVALADAEAVAYRDHLAAHGKLTEAYQKYFAAKKKADKDLLAQTRARVEEEINQQRKALDDKQENGEIGRIVNIVLNWRGTAASSEVGLERVLVKAVHDVSIGAILRNGPQGGQGSVVSVALRDAQNLAKALPPIPNSPSIEVPIGDRRVQVAPEAVVLGPVAAPASAAKRLFGIK